MPWNISGKLCHGANQQNHGAERGGVRGLCLK